MVIFFRKEVTRLMFVWKSHTVIFAVVYFINDAVEDWSEQYNSHHDNKTAAVLGLQSYA